MSYKVHGGSKFEAAVNDLAKKFKDPGSLRVGFLEGATYPDGTGVAEVAYYNEFGRTVTVTADHPLKAELGGTYYQAPRPFFRNMISAKENTWPTAIANLLSSTNYDTERTLMLTGEGIAKQLRQSIQELTSPPLAPATVAAKGFDKPLIDSGLMYNKVSYEVATK